MKDTRNTSLPPPAQRALGIAIGVLALAGAPASSMAAIVCSSPSPALSVPATFDGTYLNLQTGVASATDAGAPGWDINPYTVSGSQQLAFNWSAGTGVRLHRHCV